MVVARVARALREPLVQLLLVGVLLFGADHLVNRADAADVIVVDEKSLVRFLQYRHRAFDASRFRARLDALSGEELSALADEYIEEEALVRQARSLGLDRNDYVARRRLVGQMEYLIEAEIEQEATTITAADVARYYERHRATLATAPRYDFRHVFVQAETAAGAADLGDRLRAGADWRELGDRFAYEREWHGVNRPRVADTFGADFAKALDKLPTGVWSGPVPSRWGTHFVFIAARTPGAVSPLKEAEPAIRDAIARERARAAQDGKVAGIVAGYHVVYDDAIGRKTGL